MLTVVELEESRAHEWPAGQIERTRHFLADRVACGSFSGFLVEAGQIDPRQIQPKLSADALNGFAVQLVDGRPQDVVALDDIVHATLEGGHIEIAAQPQGTRNDVADTPCV